MPQRNGAAIDVDLVGIPTEILVDGTSLGGEGFIGFDKVQAVGLPTRFFKRHPACRNRSGAHDRRIDARRCPRNDTGQRFNLPLFCLVRRHEYRRRRAVVDARSIAGGHRAFLGEGRAQLGKIFGRGSVFRVLVGIDHRFTLAGLDGHRDDLVGELTGLLGVFGLGLRMGGEGVLFFPG